MLVVCWLDVLNFVTVDPGADDSQGHKSSKSVRVSCCPKGRTFVLAECRVVINRTKWMA